MESFHVPSSLHHSTMGVFIALSTVFILMMRVQTASWCLQLSC